MCSTELPAHPTPGSGSLLAFGQAILLLALAASAGSTSKIETFRFTLNATGVVTLQSYGYAGGVVNATTIPAGGFAPFAVIFAPLGGDWVQSTIDNGGHCGVTLADPVTGNCDDPYVRTTLSAGTYDLVLSVWDNVPQFGTLADGYKQTGNLVSRARKAE